jgi:hypothetical protein
LGVTNWHVAFSKTLGGLAALDAEIADIARTALEQFVMFHTGSSVEDVEPSLNSAAAWDVFLTFHFSKLAEFVSGLKLFADSQELDPGLRVLISNRAFLGAPDRLEWARSERRKLQESIGSFQSQNHYDL